MRCYAIILSNGEIHQLIEAVRADKIKTFPELGIETAAETIPLLGITISMIARVLAQVVEDLCVLQHRAGSLCQCQELIHLPVHESLGDMMHPEGGPEFVLEDYMVSR